MRRLNEDGAVMPYGRAEQLLNTYGKQANDKLRRDEEQTHLRHQRPNEEMQQTGSRKRAAASASAGTGAAPGAGEAAAPGAGEAASAGAGEAALAGSQSRSRSRSPFSSIAVQADGQWQRSRRHRRRSTPRQLEPASSSRTPRPEVGAATRAAEAVPMPLTATATSLRLQPKCKARAGASSKIEPMRTPVRDVLLDSQEDAWVRVGDGWLTGRASPESEEELKSWGADVVVSLQSTGEGGGIAHGIVAAAASARALAYSNVCPVCPTWRSDYSDEDCKQLARAVVFIDEQLRRGHRVVVHCRNGKQRTGVASYLLLRLHGEAQADSLSMMKTMRLKMCVNKHRGLFDKAERVLTDSAFMLEYTFEHTVFCI